MLGAELQRHGVRAWCMNDAALLLPAAGIDHGIGVIAGTGCIAVGADAAGRQLITGGWGSILGDDAGAAGIVRDATRAALYGHDDGIPDDGLLAALLVAFEVDTAERLARCVNDNPAAQHWGVAAPAVFAAADAGSVLARGVVRAAGQHLVRLVDQLVMRQAVGTTVVAAGSVIAHQPRLLDAFRENLRISQPYLEVQLLGEAPVTGALNLARRLQSETSRS
jgi:N-acetylglucosamine kinase-like BadF-type ATPase